MKKHLLSIVAAMILPFMGFAQGIEFEHGTWQKVLDIAQQTNKPIFVDVYTTWCGPCKMMSRDIFPLEEVGRVYNAEFVCYKIDAEKGEGIDIARKYEVTAYPTYLFLKPDGTLFYRALGSMDAKSFIQKAVEALAEFKSDKSIDVWEKEYTGKKNDPAFLLTYMEKRSKLGMPNAEIFEQYLQILPEAERCSQPIAELYKKESSKLKITSLAYTNLQKNRACFEKELSTPVLNKIMFGAVSNSLREATKTKNDDLMKQAMNAFESIPADASLPTKDELYMQYYDRTGNFAMYLTYATNFANNNLMKISNDSINEKEKANIAIIEERIKSGTLNDLDNTKLAEIREYVSHMEHNRISQNLNNIAWNVFLHSTDKKMLKQALRWSARSLELAPENPGWIDTYANLLYKLGKKKQAIAKEEEALAIANKKGNAEFKKGIEDTLLKMRSGEKTWKE